MSKLQDTLILFRYILDEYCAKRKIILVWSCIDIVTLSEPIGGTSNPIEMHAHYHKRYVGDMLTWLHQAISIEKENILILIKDSNKTDQNLLIITILLIICCIQLLGIFILNVSDQIKQCSRQVF